MFLKKTSIAILLIATAILTPYLTAAEPDPLSNPKKTSITLEQLRQTRREIAQSQRRIIFNNDGGDAFYFPKNRPATAAGLLARRPIPQNTHIDTMSYCSLSAGFGVFTHRTKVGEFITKYPSSAKNSINLAPILVEQGTDPLQVMVDEAKSRGKEIFWSMRMNDTHDARHPFLWSNLKTKHPEYLFAPKAKSLPLGRWSAVDYSHPEIRDLAFRYLEEVCQNYDIDGIELDFFRHLYLFKSVAYGNRASQKELGMLTDLLTRIRAMTEREGLKRGRPILVSIRVPDSVEFSKGVGIDLERWLADGLVDILIGSGYFILNPWEYLVELGHKYNVQVYANISDPRVHGEGKLKRNQAENFRAQASNAWRAGVDGIYVFNRFHGLKTYLCEIGEPQSLNTLDKTYFATYMVDNSNQYLKNGKQYQNLLPRVLPKRPASIHAGQPLEVPIRIGDDFKAAMAHGYQPTITCTAWIADYRKTSGLTIRVNGHHISDLDYDEPYLTFTVDPKILHRGKNVVQFHLPRKTSAGQDNISDKWFEERIFNSKKTLGWPGERPFWRWPLPHTGIIQEGSLYINNEGLKPSTINMMLHPWKIRPNQKTIIETEIKVKKSSTPLAVALRIANGIHVEYVTFSENSVDLKYAKKSYAMNTTNGYHLYRVEIQNKDLRVYVDGQLKINATGKFSMPVTNTESHIGIKTPIYRLTTINEQGLGLGSFTKQGKGSAWYKFIRYKSSVLSLRDLALQIKYTKKSNHE